MDTLPPASPENPVRIFKLDISKWILVFLGFLLVVLVFAQIGVAAKWLDPQPISALFDMYKTIALPILMLVLGHYFGSKSKG